MGRQTRNLRKQKLKKVRKTKRRQKFRKSRKTRKTGGVKTKPKTALRPPARLTERQMAAAAAAVVKEKADRLGIRVKELDDPEKVKAAELRRFEKESKEWHQNWRTTQARQERARRKQRAEWAEKRHEIDKLHLTKRMEHLLDQGYSQKVIQDKHNRLVILKDELESEDLLPELRFVGEQELKSLNKFFYPPSHEEFKIRSARTWDALRIPPRTQAFLSRQGRDITKKSQ